MFSRTKLFFKLQNIAPLCYASTEAIPAKSKNHLFFDRRVQKLLRKLTNVDFEKVFRPRSYGEKRKPPVYKLLTTEELEEEQEKIEKKAHRFLQMPPVVDERKEINEVLTVDPGLDGHDIHHAKYVFTDISFDLRKEERTVVVREPNGTLRKATWDERHRVIQIYDPLPGREIEMPRMFTTEFFQRVLENEEYEFILDRACVQFEPDDPVYHKITKETYEAINEKGHFERLHSTRHFGCLAFYLVTNKKIDDMLIDNIKSERIENAYDLVKLYLIVHPDCESAKSSEGKSDPDILKEYIERDSMKKSVLEMTLKNYLNKKEEIEELERGIKKAHGL